MMKKYDLIKYIVLLGAPGLFLFLLLSGSWLSGEEETTPTQTSETTQTTEASLKGQYAGSEICAGCHEDIVTAFEKTIHAQKGFDMRTDKGCETCHGPAAEHADSGDPELIKSFKTMQASESGETCLGCHESGMQKHWKGSVHEMRGLGCVSCHSVHTPKSDKWQLKAERVEHVCADCHQEVKAQIQRTSHHPIREELMSCNDCHNPHGTLTPKMITANSVNEQCYSCHTEKRGPFLWDHPPVRENCLSCHTPHGSNHEKLLAQNRPWLCQNCHMDTRHPGTLYDGTTKITSNRELARSCSNCHSNIHGSNHPSGRVFTR